MHVRDYLQAAGHVRCLIQFEDDRLSDRLCVDPRNGRGPTFSPIRADKELLDTVRTDRRAAGHLKTADSSMRLRDTRRDPVALDRLDLWLQQRDSATIHYDQFV